jgi:O-antigen/teichoic acid export membrane protein
MHKYISKLYNNKAILNSASYLFINSVVALVSIVLIPILTRILTVSEYGVVGIFQSIMAITTVLVGLGGHESARVRYFKSDKREYVQIISTVIFILLLSTFVTIFFVFVFSSNLIEFLAVDMTILMLAVVGAVGQFIVNLRLSMLQISNEVFKYGVLQISVSTAGAITSVLFVWYMMQGADGRIYGVVGPLVVIAVLLLVTMYIKGEISKESITKNAFKIIVDYSLPLIPHALIAIFAVSFARIALNIHHGEESVGLYFVAWQLATPILIIVGSINLAFKTWSYEKMSLGEHRQVISASYFSMVIIIIISLVYGVVLYVAYPYIVGENFVGSRNLAMIMVVGMMLSGLYLVVVKGMLYSEKTKILSLYTSIIGIMFAISTYFVAEWYSLLSVAAAYVVYQFAMFVGTWYLSSLYYPQPWLDVIIKSIRSR